LVPGSIRAMIYWSSSASWGRARAGHHVIDGALKLDAKSSGHFPSRAHSSEGLNKRPKTKSDTPLPFRSSTVHPSIGSLDVFGFQSLL